MKTIYFKNGMTLKISQNDHNLIVQRLNSGAAMFQTFSKENESVYTINLSEIVFIN